jgi:TolB-like protein/tetratricopeptide (TPR) repeat protein
VALPAGASLGSYTIVRLLGSGGMGEVYEAWDSKLQRRVALKVLSRAEREVGRSSAQLLREARAAAALNHPNVCTIYEVGEAGGTPFIAMELVEGELLQHVIARGALAPARVCRLGQQLTSALARAHAAGVIHQDLKSANVIVTPDDHAKILDFGIARRIAAPTATTRTVTDGAAVVGGTLPYMAPEVLGGRTPTAQSDIWALGILLYEMVSGRRPFSGETGAAIAAAILRDPLPALPAGTPPGLAGVIYRCLERDEAIRPKNAGDMSLALDIAGAAPAPPASRRARSRVFAGISATIALIVAMAVVAWRWPGGGTSSGAVNAIAVLPFANLSGDPEQDFFSDGVTEAVITDLGKIGALRVIARGSVMPYKTRPRPPSQTARELGVDALIDGSVLRVGDRVRITAQLIAPDDGRVLWSDRFDRDTRDLLALHADIATAVARQVRATVAPSEARQLAVTYSPDPKAHELYLLGRFHAYRKNPDSARKSVEYLLEATRLDPGFALAYAALAEAYRLRGIWGQAGLGAYAEESRAAATRALQLDPRLPEAHMALAIVLSQQDWNWSEAELAFRRAIEANPNLSDAHAEYSFHLQSLGRFADGVAAAQHARALDPLSPDHLSQEGRALFRARRYDEAVQAFERALEVDPNFGSAVSRLIDTFIVTGRYAEAESLLQKRRDLLGEARVQTAQVYAKTGRLAAARALLTEEDSSPPVGGGGGAAVALVHLALGDPDRALASLERAVSARRMLAFTLRDPRFDAIAATPRFRQILKDMNLPD